MGFPLRARRAAGRLPLMWPAPGRGARVGSQEGVGIANQRETHVAETETGSAKLGQQALVTEIEKTRMELAKTIDAISEAELQPCRRKPAVSGASSTRCACERSSESDSSCPAMNADLCATQR